MQPTNLVSVVQFLFLRGRLHSVLKAIISALLIGSNVPGALTSNKDVVWLNVQVHHVQGMDKPGLKMTPI